MSRNACIAPAVIALLAAAPAWGATDRDIEEIRAQIRELKESYEARIRALEERLKEAEGRALPAPAPAVAAPSASPGATPSAFNPAVSATLSGRYANLSRDPAQFRFPGFLTGGEIGPGPRGFSLAESELTLSANVDPKFFGNATFAITPEDTIEVEEAYGVVTAMPAGFTPKFGRFFSAQGYLNEQHAHAWDFVDLPFAYQAFLGGQYRTDGIQVKWLAPLEHFLEIGGEVGSSDAFPGSSRSKNGAGSSVVYARTGGDIGESHSWLAGVSWLRTRAQDRISTGVDRFGGEADLSFTGKSEVVAADFVWKYAPNGNPRVTNLKVQGEYLWRKEAGEMNQLPYSSRQSGWYVQGVYQFMPTWRAGVRYDRLDPGSVDYGANAALFETSTFAPTRSTVMADWSPSEFSRLRLQLARSKTVAGMSDTEGFVQYILSLGAHGAHKY